MQTAKDNGRVACIAYFQLPVERRRWACYYVRTVEEKQRKAGMTIEDIAIAGQMFFWCNCEPTRPPSGSSLTPSTTPTSSKQSERKFPPAITNGKIEDLNHLLNNSPLLNAAFDELLRLVTASSSARTVEKAVVIDNQELCQPAKLHMPHDQLHMNEDVFGPNIRAFDPDRFLNKTGLDRSPSFKPFGGGTTSCSGRFLARREVFAFTALAVCRFDLSLADKGQKFPKLDESKMTLGIMAPVKGDRLMVSMRPRVAGVE